MEKQKGWILITLSIPIKEQDLVSSVLFDLGTLGVVTLAENADSFELGAYFEDNAAYESLIDDLNNTLKDLMPEAEINVRVSKIENQDWMQKWKEGFEPTEAGEKFLIAPSWKIAEIESAIGAYDNRGGEIQPNSNRSTARTVNGRILIQIDPGMAFGTGTHETTRLCLEEIERYWDGGKLLDVGTGTGILSIAAGLLRPGSTVIGIDVDPLAVEVARENLAINFAAPSTIEILEGQPEDFGNDRFDVVVANLTAEVIIQLLPDLLACLAPAGHLILSGILTELEPSVVRALSESRLAVIERRQAGEWAAVVARPSS